MQAAGETTFTITPVNGPLRTFRPTDELVLELTRFRAELHATSVPEFGSDMSRWKLGNPLRYVYARARLRQSVAAGFVPAEFEGGMGLCTELDVTISDGSGINKLPEQQAILGASEEIASRFSQVGDPTQYMPHFLSLYLPNEQFEETFRLASTAQIASARLVLRLEGLYLQERDPPFPTIYVLRPGADGRIANAQGALSIFTLTLADAPAAMLSALASLPDRADFTAHTDATKARAEKFEAQLSAQLAKLQSQLADVNRTLLWMLAVVGVAVAFAIFK